MRHRSTCVVVLLANLLGCRCVSAFYDPPLQWPSHLHRSKTCHRYNDGRSSSCLGMMSNAQEEEEEGDDEKKAMLIFGVTVDKASDPLPEGTTAKDVTIFLQDPTIKCSLLSAGGTRPVEEVPMTPQLESLWKQVCQEDYSNDDDEMLLPAEGDSILVTDTSTKFPGLTMTNKVYNAAKLDNSTAGGIPKYTFMLIGEQLSVSGLPPVVWVFNKLTGNDKREAGVVNRPSGVAMSEITALQKEEDGSIYFNFHAEIQIKIQFPATLLKILPTNKEKAEASGSKAIQKSVDRDVEKGIQGVRESFIEYLVAYLQSQ